MDSKLLELLILTLLISPTGALAPGPLTTVTIIIGSRGGYISGLKTALGHTIVELPYVLLLVLAMSHVKYFLENLIVKLLLTSFAITFIIYFSYLTILDASKLIKGVESNVKSDYLGKWIHAPLISGIVLTGFNPLFLVWWYSVGLPIITGVVDIGITIFPIVYATHVWLDYAWLAFIAEASKRGLSIVSKRIYGYVLLGLAIILLGLAGLLLWNVLQNYIISLP